MFFQVATSCIKTVNQIITKDSRSTYLSFDELNNMFLELQTIEHAKKWLLGIFDEYREMIEGINNLKSNKHYNLVEKMQEYIRQNYSDINISVESVADIAGYTPYYFSKIFRELTGYNVNDYLRNVRINKAKEFLSGEEHKINEIHKQVGFVNFSHFCKVFKKDVGLTPSAFREYALQNHNE